VNQPLDREPIAALLRAAGYDANLTGADLTVLSTKGISHDHWRVGRKGTVLRIPRMSQWGLDPDAALAYQAAAFDRAAPSGRTPVCRGVLAPGPALPRGALVVDEVRGRPPKLPDDLPAIAETLALVHGLALPDESGFAPLQVHRNPVSSTLQVIEEQSAALAVAGLEPESEAAILAEMEWARDIAGQGEPDFETCLVGTDTHPGNFLIDAAGDAWFVDLEKALYGAAPIDLAHATLPTSTGWDPDVAGQMSRADVEAFYQRYLDRVGRDRAAEIGPWLLPARRLTWLRTMTWFVRWRAEWATGEQAATRDSAMTEHVRRHIDACFEPAAIEATRADWLAPRALMI
jgi:hypothetical protein